MTSFEVGKSYRTYGGGMYTVTKRTEAFVTFTSAGGTQTLRRKPYKHVDGYEWVAIPYNKSIRAIDAK